MACYIAPTAVALATTIFRKKFPEKLHIGWFNTMAWGGALALTVEHIAHGEIVPRPPFLTALANPADFSAMLGEIAAVGIPMTLAIVAVWAMMVVSYEKILSPEAKKSFEGA